MAEIVQFTIQSASGTLNIHSAKTAPTPHGFLVTNPDSLIDPGAIAWRRYLVTSPFCDGDIEVHSVLGTSTLALQVLILATSQVDMQAKQLLLLTAIRNRVWELHIVIDGTEWAWQCRRADYGLQFSRRSIHALSCQVNISAPRRPLSVLGPI